MVGFYLAFSLLPLLGFNEKEVVKLMSFREPTLATTPLPNFQVFVTEAELLILSTSAFEAERWLKSHLFLHSPSTKTTKIIVDGHIFCNERFGNDPMLSSLLLTCVKNLHTVMEKWRMVKQIEISLAPSSDCFVPDELLEPLLSFMQDSNLSYSMDQHHLIRTHEQITLLNELNLPI